MPVDPDPALLRQDGLERWAGEGITAGHGKADLGLGLTSDDGFEARLRAGYGLYDRLVLGGEAWAQNRLDGTGWNTGVMATLTYSW